jgi:hypothetical protein
MTKAECGSSAKKDQVKYNAAGGAREQRKKS